MCISNPNRSSACPLTLRASGTAQLVSMWQHSPSLLKQVPTLPTGNGFWLVPGHCLKSTGCRDDSHPKTHTISTNSHISVTTCALFSSLFLLFQKKGKRFSYFLIKENKVMKYYFFKYRPTGKCATVKQSMKCCGDAMNKSFQKHATAQSAF